MVRTRSRGQTGSTDARLPHSLEEWSSYMNALAERSEEVSRRIRGASDLVSQVVEVQAGMRRGARRVFRLRTLVIIAVVVVVALVVRAALAGRRANEPTPEGSTTS
ncbi:MAG: hypothetical protein DYH08_00570 [Actinobacteria bacterium ATB1]|nr:hypothetical protein [Actinobacteria bacterium ATB1]